MIKSPSKFLKRSFLHALVDNRFLSPSGLEYDEGEVRDLINKKEMEAADHTWRREMRELELSRRPTLADMVSQITTWQSALAPNTGILKGTENVGQPIINSVKTNKKLNSTPHSEITSNTTELEGETSMSYMGYPVLKVGTHTRASVKRALAHMDEIHAKIGKANAEAAAKNSLKRARQAARKIKK